MLNFVSKAKSDEQIQCACGCGKLRTRFDKKGREMKFLTGHNDNWKNKRLPLLICPMCKKEFKRNKKDQKVCSLACRRLRNKQKRPYQERQVEISCFTCGIKFLRKKSGVGNRNFCCQECKNQWMSETYSQNISQPSKLAKKRDENKCRICGFDIIVEVHHIIARRNGGKDELNNLITLCPNHHTMADRLLISIKDLQKLIAD